MKRQRGFSLLEVILAFTLLAVALGILMAILGGGLTQVRGAADATVATLHAQSLLDEVGVLEPIEPGRRGGDFDNGRYRWDLEITEVEDPAPTRMRRCWKQWGGSCRRRRGFTASTWKCPGARTMSSAALPS